jgi:DNA-binding transcriptional MerR regulator
MYAISDVEKQTGLTASTLRYYEKEGIIPKVNRNEGGRRVFSQAELEWLELVIALKNTGMTIEEIKHYMELIKKGDETQEERRNFLLQHKLKVEKEIAQKQMHLEKIIRKMAFYDLVILRKTEREFLI